ALELAGDALERLVPRDPLELTLSLRTDTQGGMEQPVRTIHPLAELPDLGADIAARNRVFSRTVDLGDPPALDRDVKGASIRAVERARRLDDMGRRTGVVVGLRAGDGHGESMMLTDSRLKGQIRVTTRSPRSALALLTHLDFTLQSSDLALHTSKMPDPHV